METREERKTSREASPMSGKLFFGQPFGSVQDTEFVAKSLRSSVSSWNKDALRAESQRATVKVVGARFAEKA